MTRAIFEQAIKDLKQNKVLLVTLPYEARSKFFPDTFKVQRDGRWFIIKNITKKGITKTANCEETYRLLGCAQNDYVVHKSLSA